MITMLRNRPGNCWTKRMVDAKAFIGRTFGGSITIVEKLDSAA